MHKVFFFILLFFVWTTNIFAQKHVPFYSLLNHNDTININVVQDSRINEFIRDLQIIQTKATYANEIPVYQVQIISTKNRLEALKIKKDIEPFVSKLPSEIVFREPYYKLKIGLYKTRQEAELFRTKMDNFFNNKKAVVVIPSVLDIETFLSNFFEKK